ncbi:MAG TPA: hypothetical protein VM008_02545 [Phycisphaerae bacterium]|nr:hypothetical protein [Phycisphaerae bacterium]
MIQSAEINHLTDGQLLAQYAAAKDADVFRVLVERHLNWVYGTAHRLTRDATLADDVAVDSR